MNNRIYLEKYTKEELLELLSIYAKDWLAMDGVWFQSVERKFGMARQCSMMRKLGSALP